MMLLLLCLNPLYYPLFCKIKELIIQSCTVICFLFVLYLPMKNTNIIGASYPVISFIITMLYIFHHCLSKK